MIGTRGFLTGTRGCRTVRIVMDPLSDVLRVVRLRGAVFFNARLSAPWCVDSLSPEGLARLVGARGGCVALFHLMVEGHCRIALQGLEPVDVEAGSIVMLPHGTSHLMGSRLESPASMEALLPRVMASLKEGTIPSVEYGGGGEEARFVCGYLHCDHRFNPLLGCLPDLLVACPRRGEIRALPGPRSGASGEEGPAEDRWLQAALDHTLAEVDDEAPGTPAMLTRLTELLYLEVVRRYMGSLRSEETGWLAGVRHPQVGEVLRLLHAEPERAWTVEALGRKVGLSRSALARRFAELVGESPMRYLTGWRMQIAQNLLDRGDLSVAQVASRVGYASEAAFNRAFKRHVGLPPATWRGARD